MKFLMEGKVETVSINRVKPAHFECEPETGTEIKRKTQPKRTHSKTAEIARGTRRDPKRSSSTFTTKSVRTGVEPQTRTKIVFDAQHWYESGNHFTVSSN